MHYALAQYGGPKIPQAWLKVSSDPMNRVKTVHLKVMGKAPDCVEAVVRYVGHH
jgi:hypothetical protein